MLDWKFGRIVAYNAPDESPQCGVLIAVRQAQNVNLAIVFGRRSATAPFEPLNATPGKSFTRATRDECDPDALAELLAAWAAYPKFTDE